MQRRAFALAVALALAWAHICRGEPPPAVEPLPDAHTAVHDTAVSRSNHELPTPANLFNTAAAAAEEIDTLSPTTPPPHLLPRDADADARESLAFRMYQSSSQVAFAHAPHPYDALFSASWRRRLRRRVHGGSVFEHAADRMYAWQVYQSPVFEVDADTAMRALNLTSANQIAAMVVTRHEVDADTGASSALALPASADTAAPAAADIAAHGDPIDMPALLLPGTTPTPVPPVTPLPPDRLQNQTVYLVGDKCYSAVLLTGTPKRCIPTFFCDYPSCACAMTIVANGAGVVFSISPLTCACPCKWSIQFILTCFVAPSFMFVGFIIYLCCTRKGCPYHQEFLAMRRVLCPWWKIDEGKVLSDALGVDHFVISADHEPAVDMMPVRVRSCIRNERFVFFCTHLVPDFLCYFLIAVSIQRRRPLVADTRPAHHCADCARFGCLTGRASRRRAFGAREARAPSRGRTARRTRRPAGASAPPRL